VSDLAHPPGPLHGIRVLDLTSVVMGPLATVILGDLGADVIAIESARGDTNRRMGIGAVAGLSDVALNLLRNKRNLAIDLKAPGARGAVLRLAATCDVFVTNLRPGPLERLGLGYEALRAVRDDIVYCRAAGYRSDSESGDDPAYDDVIQAAAGVTDVVAKAGHEPALMPTLLADKVSGLTVAYAILAALVHRERSGEGQLVEVAMTEATEAFLMVEHSIGVVAEPGPTVGYSRVLTPRRRPQRSADGSVMLFPYLPEHWRALLEEIGEEDLALDPRLYPGRRGDTDFAYGLLERIAPRRTTSEWIEFCRARQIPVTRVASIDEVVTSWPVATHPLAGRYHQVPSPARFSATPASVRREAPLVGEHNREVLAEAGLSSDEIDALERSGALRER
jgi:crotonobetainyl-CoA:carnitine CoA-transferase CaiB-like acyl-CoA transferase